MGIRLIQSIFKIAIKSDYYNRFSFAFELLSINFTLFIYYFTSKALAPELGQRFSLYKTSYFEFILFAEIFLCIPLFFFEGSVRKMKQALYDGVWTSLVLVQASSIRSLFIISMTGIPKEILRIILTLICASIFFNLHINFIALSILSFYITLFIPLFFSLGVIAAVFLIKYGRGQGIVGYINTLLSIMAGSYFPITVLPDFVQRLTSFSPHTLLLENSRLFYASMDFQNLTNGLFALIIFTLILSIFAYYLFNKTASKNITDITLRF